MRHFFTLLGTVSLFFLLLLAPLQVSADADDGRTGEDFSDLLYSSKDLLEGFDMSRARGMCGAREAINEVHTLFKTRATLLAGDDTDPSEQRSWSNVSGSNTNIRIDWTPYSSKSSAGVIMVRGNVANDCTGKSPRDLKWASVRFNIPVNIGRDGKFYASAPSEIQVETICCGSQRITRIALFTPTGQIIRAEGTIYPPVATQPKPPPRPTTPTTTGLSQPATTPTTTSSTPQPKPVVATAPPPPPKPDPWTMENPCPECEDEKAVVEHYQQRIANLKKEKAEKEKELRKTEGEIEDLEKKNKRLQERLKNKEGTGAESLDTTTGIRTSAYDQGDGTVVVKRIYPDGREEIVDTYNRRSSEDILREINANNRKIERLKQTKERLSKRIKNLDAEIKKTEELLRDALAAFKACLDNCNRKLGYSSAAVIPVGTAGTALASSLPGGEGETSVTADSPETTVTDSGVGGSGEDTGTSEPGSQASAEQTIPTLAADETVPDVSAGATSYSDLEWSIKYSPLSGYTYFNKFGHIDYDYEIDLSEETGTEGTDGAAEIDYSFRPSEGTTDWNVGIRYKFSEQYADLGIKYEEETEAASSSSPAATSNILGLSSPRYNYVNHAYNLLDEGAPTSYVGRAVGIQYFGKPALLNIPPWYYAAREVIDILDDYDGYEEDIYPDEYGTAVAHAVLAAGGSPRDAMIMAAKATAYAGGSPADIGKVKLSILYNGYPLNVEIPNYLSWHDMAVFHSLAVSLNKVLFGFSVDLLEESPPSQYFGFRQLVGGIQRYGSYADAMRGGVSIDEYYRQQYGYTNQFNGYNSPGFDANGVQEIDSIDLNQFYSRPNLRYDVVGGKTGSSWSSFEGQSSEPKYITPRFQGFQIDPQWFDKTLGVETQPETGSETSFLFPVFGEGNMSRDPQDTRITPNDPLYREEEGSVIGSIAKKGFGLVMGVLGVGATTNDAPADYQWGMHAVGLTPRGSNSAWDIYDGSEPNVVVAVIDSGSDFNHPDAPEHYWQNADEIPGNNVDDDNNGYVDDVYGWNFVSENNNVQDDYGHGAFVAGIIAAKTDNNIGIAGINPGAQIMTLKVAGDRGKSRSLGIYRAIRYAVDNGARVINISLGKEGLSKLEELGINYAWNMGCLVVVAAGNQAGIVSEYGPPGAHRAFSVASVNVNGERRGTSNRGRNVTIAAPGEAIYSLSSSTGRRDGTIMPISNTEYHRLNGTSFAAPFVSGAASLIWAKYPELTNRQLANILMASAEDMNEPGWDTRTGAGMLNVRKAMMMAAGELAAGLRITDIKVGRKGSKINWVDLYGVVDGPVETYSIYVAEGTDPDEDDYVEVYGPAATQVDHGLLCRISGEEIDGRRWTFKLAAKLANGDNREVVMAFDRDGKIVD